MSTHKCAVNGRLIGGPELQVNGTADIDTDCGGTGHAIIGHEEGTVDEIVGGNLHRRVAFNRLGRTASQHIDAKQGMKGERTASERRLASSGFPTAVLRTRVSPTDGESSDMLTVMRV